MLDSFSIFVPRSDSKAYETFCLWDILSTGTHSQSYYYDSFAAWFSVSDSLDAHLVTRFLFLLHALESLFAMLKNLHCIARKPQHQVQVGTQKKKFVFVTVPRKGCFMFWQKTDSIDSPIGLAETEIFCQSNRWYQYHHCSRHVSSVPFWDLLTAPVIDSMRLRNGFLQFFWGFSGFFSLRWEQKLILTPEQYAYCSVAIRHGTFNEDLKKLLLCHPKDLAIQKKMAEVFIVVNFTCKITQSSSVTKFRAL